MKKYFLLPAWFYLAIILLMSAIFMGYAAFTDSAITDELAHIPAGYSYVRFLDYRLNPEHPPLLKALSGIPLLFLHLRFPIDKPSWTTDINGQWTAGTQFLYESGNDANTIIHTARIAPIIVTLATIFLLYWASKKLIGRYWALVPTFLFAFSPIVLAHGHYVTTDIAATGGILLALVFFVQFLKNPTPKTLFWAGITFGVAQLAKFSAVLLIPTFGIFLFVYWLAATLQHRYGIWWKDSFIALIRLIIQTIGVGIIGVFFVVYPLYALLTIHYPQEKQTSDTQSILTSFGEPASAGHRCSIGRCIADLTIAATQHTLSRPLAQYALGVLMVTQRAAGGNTNYFNGIVSASGSRLYFPLVYGAKESIPVLMFLCVALFVGIRNGVSLFRKIGWRNIASKKAELIAMYPELVASGLFVLIYWGYSMKSPLNIGVRHILPTIPFLYLLATVFWKKWILQFDFHRGVTLVDTIKSAGVSIVKTYFKVLTVCIILIWVLFETISTAPYFLSSFNEFAGGTRGGYRLVTDSNYDWGQDMIRLQEFMNSHPEIDRFAIDYFGAGNSTYYFGERAVNWSSDKGNPELSGIHYLVVSVNTLQSAIQKTSSDFDRNPKDEYRWLTETRHPALNAFGEVPLPDFRVGTTLFVYKL